MISERKIILQNSGRIDPEKIDDYISAGGYIAAGKALGTTGPEIIDEIIASGLRGRGGAGFPTGLKAQYVQKAVSKTGQKYLICNADEGEPGTFKDRIIMESDPHLLLEGIIVASYCCGASKAIIYIRGEYFKSIDLINKAIRQCEQNGFLGKNIFNSTFSLDIEVKQGAGSYLCGEELTLLESAEGKRGYPRIKPPFPAEKGLFDMPTLVCNVETLANLPAIIKNGSAWYSSLGLPDSHGTKIFTISGDVVSPGYYEVELGVTLRELIYELAGGISGDRKLKAVLVGGAAGTFVNETVIDTPVGYDSLKAVGATLGSGAIIVLDETRDLLQSLRSVLKFFQHESCGKCVPCRVGTTYLSTVVEKMIKDKSGAAMNIDILVAEAEYMAKNSLCPLGQSPVLPLKSLKRYFAHEFPSVS